jgi:PAS domain S-box-containing protein
MPKDTPEARNRAIVRALPDLMFVLHRDGTIIEHHARDPRLLFVPPEAFLGRKVSDVLPPPVGEAMARALDQAYESDEPVVVEYELTVHERQYFEARIVRVSTDRLLSIVRDVTEMKRAAALNRDLARRLISSQELERQRIARELHDDFSQRLAALNIEIDSMTATADSEEWRVRLRRLSAQTAEIASDIHHLAYDLHPWKLQLIGLVGALRSLCTDVSKQGQLEVTYSPGVVPTTVDATASLCLYRIVQEALQNVARHSHAGRAHVGLTCQHGQIEVQISDSGIGFDPTHVQHAGGLGLVSMRERAAEANGQLTVDAIPGRGTRITVRVPLASEASLPA